MEFLILVDLDLGRFRMNKLLVRNNPSFSIGPDESVIVKWEKIDNLVGWVLDTASGELQVDSSTDNPVKILLRGNIVTDTSDAGAVFNIKLLVDGNERRRIPMLDIVSPSPVSHQFTFEEFVFYGNKIQIEVQRAGGSGAVNVAANGLLTHMTGSYEVQC